MYDLASPAHPTTREETKGNSMGMRRVVTGTDLDGKSYPRADGKEESAQAGSMDLELLWHGGSTPMGFDDFIKAPVGFPSHAGVGGHHLDDPAAQPWGGYGGHSTEHRRKAGFPLDRLRRCELCALWLGVHRTRLR